MENPICPPINPGTVTVGTVNGLTTTLKLCVALKPGVPLSVTTTVTGLVVLACVTSGRQLKIPLLETSVAFVGPTGRLNVNVCAGTSVSVTLLVMLRLTPTLTVRFDTADKTGAVFVAGRMMWTPTVLVQEKFEASVTLNMKLPKPLVPMVELNCAVLPLKTTVPLVAPKTTYVGLLFVNPRVYCVSSTFSVVPFVQS